MEDSIRVSYMEKKISNKLKWYYAKNCAEYTIIFK